MRRDGLVWEGMIWEGRLSLVPPAPPYNAIGEESSSHHSPIALKPLCLSEVELLLRCVVSYVLKASGCLMLPFGTLRFDPSF